MQRPCCVGNPDRFDYRWLIAGLLAIVKAGAAYVPIDPAYPLELMSDRIEGTVVLYAVIHSDGTVGEVRVLEGVESQLDENAMAALKHWKFRPGNRGGVPVDVEDRPMARRLPAWIGRGSLSVEVCRDAARVVAP